MESFPDLQIIYRVLAEFGLQQHGVQRIDVSTMDSYQLHPVPKGLECRDLRTTGLTNLVVFLFFIPDSVNLAVIL